MINNRTIDRITIAYRSNKNNRLNSHWTHCHIKGLEQVKFVTVKFVSRQMAARNFNACFLLNLYSFFAFYTIYTLEFYCEHILKEIYIQGVFI